jgi:hypothetical protein
MELSNIELLLRVLIAHFLSDFVFQPTFWAQEKDKKGIKSPYFWYHISVTIGVLAIMIGNIHYWSILLMISVGHIIIDAIKPIVCKSNVWVFIADQLVHLLVIVLIWLSFTTQFQLFWTLFSNIATIQKNWWILLFYIILSIPASVTIGKMTEKWGDELEGENSEQKSKGLKDAGKWIGILERLMIFTFIVINELSAIGFLLAAKSVFRFGDLKNSSEHKKTEYIIIGTFTSFSIAIAAGLLYKIVTN